MGAASSVWVEGRCSPQRYRFNRAFSTNLPSPMGSFCNWRPGLNVRSWLRLLKKSAVGWREDLPDLILQGTNGNRGHLNGSTRPQDRVSGASAGPPVSIVQNTACWARIFEPWAVNRLFQQPRLDSDVLRGRREGPFCPQFPTFKIGCRLCRRLRQLYAQLRTLGEGVRKVRG